MDGGSGDGGGDDDDDFVCQYVGQILSRSAIGVGESRRLSTEAEEDHWHGSRKFLELCPKDS